MSNSITKWIQSLRYGDVGLRRKWFFVVTSILFVFVVVCWAVFLSPFSVGERSAKVESFGSLSHFWGVLKSGMSVAWDQFTGDFTQSTTSTTSTIYEATSSILIAPLATSSLN